MPGKNKHHFIPACYLAGFTNEGTRKSQFLAVSANEDDRAFITTPNDSCEQRNYYKLEGGVVDVLSIENWYGSKIEPKIASFLSSLNTIASMPKEREGLYLLLASLKLRTPKYRKIVEGPVLRSKEIAKNIQNSIFTPWKKVFPLELWSTKNEIIILELELIDDVIDSMRKKKWRFNKSQDGSKLLTSDSPFIYINPKYKIFGLDTEFTQIIVPINKYIYLHGTNEVQEEGIFPVTKKEIACVNYLIRSHCDKYYYSADNNFIIIDKDSMPTIKNIVPNK